MMVRLRLAPWLSVLAMIPLAACGNLPKISPTIPAPTPTSLLPVQTSTSTASEPPTHTPPITPTAGPTMTATLDAPSLFELAGAGPIVPHGVLPDHDYTFIGPVVEHDGLYYLFYSSFPENSGVAMNTGYATSADMRVWETAGEEPLLTSADVEFGRRTPFASVSSAVVEEDGTWTLYLNVWEPNRNGDSAIFRAAAPAPGGPWTIGEAPVLLPGAEGAWDGGAVFGAYVIRTDGGYVMYYNGSAGGGGVDAIGMATSEDGIVWEQRGDPVFSAEPGAAWDSGGVSMPVVQRLGDRWAMLYTSIQPGGERAFGLALSEDGVAWARHPANPVFTPEDIPDVLFLHSAHLFCDDQCWLVVEIVQQTSGFSDLWLAEQVGVILP